MNNFNAKLIFFFNFAAMKASKKTIHPLERYISLYARSHGLKKIVATISGGADSVALLAALASAPAIDTTALHCNFHLRGEESMRDQQHVESICRALGIKLYIKDFDVNGYREREKGCSVEMACRELRYEWFREMAAGLGADRIATGHNADDNIETLFLNLMRGSGTTGLRGMLPDSGEIWRPLLFTHRSEITEYLKEKGISYVTDSSNLSSDYRRNFLRNEIIPMLRSRWEGFDKAMGRSLEHLREENKIVERMVGDSLPPAGMPLRSETVMDFPAPELLIRRYAQPLRPFATTAAEVLAAIHADKPDIRRWQLPGGTLMLRNKKLYLIP